MMMRVLAAIAVTVLAAFSAPAGERGTKEEAVAMAEAVKASVLEHGVEATVAAIHDQGNTEFHYHDLYPVMLDTEGNALAHGHKPVLAGKNLINLRDAVGKQFVRALLAKVEEDGSGWVEYQWADPHGGVSDKTTYALMINDELLVNVGVYR